MKTGIELIAEERQRQIEVKGWTQDHDKSHGDESIAYAAACYAIPKNGRNIYAGQGGLSNVIRVLWPWNITWWKPTPENRIRELQKAGALIAAEIDRIMKDYEECTSCDKLFPFETMSSDDAGNYFCPECWKVLEPVMKAEYEELKSKGEIE